MRRLLVSVGIVVSMLSLGGAIAAEWTQDDVVMDYRENSAAKRREITYQNGDVRLAATLLTPSSGQAIATAVIIQGSGHSSRKNIWAGMVAQLFANNGVAVVFPDKRGTGDSGGDLATATFEGLAEDALAAVAYIRAHPELGAPDNKVGLIGLSQGGRITPLAASLKPEDVDFIVNLSGGATAGYQSIRNERENTYWEKGVTLEWLLRFRACDAAVDQLLFEQIELEDYLPCTTLFDSSPYAAFAKEIYPSDPNDWRARWFRQVLAYDPLPYWDAIEQPSFTAYGQRDELENVQVVRSVELLTKSFEKRNLSKSFVGAYPGVGHALWRQEDGRFLFDRTFVDDLQSWIEETVAGR